MDNEFFTKYNLSNSKKDITCYTEGYQLTNSLRERNEKAGENNNAFFMVHNIKKDPAK